MSVSLNVKTCDDEGQPYWDHFLVRGVVERPYSFVSRPSLSSPTALSEVGDSLCAEYRPLHESAANNVEIRLSASSISSLEKRGLRFDGMTQKVINGNIVATPRIAGDPGGQLPTGGCKLVFVAFDGDSLLASATSLLDLNKVTLP